MDANGVGFAMAYAGAATGSPDETWTASDVARSMNEFGADLVCEHPSRFGMFATLPMTDVGACLNEIAYCEEALATDGYAINTSYQGRWLGHADFKPVFRELNERKAVVFVHPSDCAPRQLKYGAGEVSGPWLEWPVNTARTILDLMIQGVLTTYPDIKFIFCHGGGVMPLLISRFAGFSGWRDFGHDRLRRVFPVDVATQFARLHFELAQAYAAENYKALSQLVPTSRILFGSDWDNFFIDHASTSFEALEIDEATRAAIGRDNALRLLDRN